MALSSGKSMRDNVKSKRDNVRNNLRTVVYVVAFACEPGRGSEPGTGFALAQAACELAARAPEWDIKVITRPHRLTKLADAFRGSPRNFTITGVGLPRAIALLLSGPRLRLGYVCWQWLAVRLIRRDLRSRGGKAIVHHVSLATEALPTFEWQLSRRTLRIYGPAGSTAVDDHDLKVRVRYILRSMLGALNLRGVRLLVAQNDRVAIQWRRYPGTTIVEPNVTVERADFSPATKDWSVAVAGHLIARKRTHLVLTAFAESGVEGRLAVVGDGPLRPQLEQLAEDLGVRDRVDFLGTLERAELLAVLARTAILIHASRQEGAGWVVGEAQAAGAVPIVFHRSGADTLIRLASAGEVVDNASELSRRLSAVWRRDRSDVSPSDRWSRSRWSGLLHQWYEHLLAEHGTRE